MLLHNCYVQFVHNHFLQPFCVFICIHVYVYGYRYALENLGTEIAVIHYDICCYMVIYGDIWFYLVI
jgi:hypothetical protein